MAGQSPPLISALVLLPLTGGGPEALADIEVKSLADESDV
jgi:hypothetical protein